MKQVLYVLIVLLVCGVSVCARQKSTLQNLTRGGMLELDHIEDSKVSANDSAQVEIGGASQVRFNAKDIIITNYGKRIRDAKETMTLVNKSRCRVSKVKVLFRYYTLDGTLIEERTVDIPCDLHPNKVQIVQIRSFDRVHQYYYHRSQAPKRVDYPVAPYKLKYEILRYDIVMSPAK